MNKTHESQTLKKIGIAAGIAGALGGAPALNRHEKVQTTSPKPLPSENVINKPEIPPLVQHMIPDAPVPFTQEAREHFQEDNQERALFDAIEKQCPGGIVKNFRNEAHMYYGSLEFEQKMFQFAFNVDSGALAVEEVQEYKDEVFSQEESIMPFGTQTVSRDQLGVWKKMYPEFTWNIDQKELDADISLAPEAIKDAWQYIANHVGKNWALGPNKDRTGALPILFFSEKTLSWIQLANVDTENGEIHAALEVNYQTPEKETILFRFQFSRDVGTSNVVSFFHTDIDGYTSEYEVKEDDPKYPQAISGLNEAIRNILQEKQ